MSFARTLVRTKLKQKQGNNKIREAFKRIRIQMVGIKAYRRLLKATTGRS